MLGAERMVFCMVKGKWVFSNVVTSLLWIVAILITCNDKKEFLYYRAVVAIIGVSLSELPTTAIFQSP